ncbi:ethanolamine-phosphate cytidylyltransferase [Aureobasidium pullulans]|uniref:ethanolamine-phosphate cytidylyltransferase n=1 Tax=Aureobasidium pullulans TaxID=5580 RepID=A0A4V4J2B5_AURPU|nr:ethanolamine-phosphate cytidylyltransferase [Aureobasidium pullulans]
MSSTETLTVSQSIPAPGKWPVDPQEDIPISDDRVWVDGCFDFAHHGHAGAMLQARRLGTELLVGVHSDEAILENKGPTVMTLDERCAAVDACRWATMSIPHAPYVTSLPWISHYGAKYVVHGDDVTSDANGYDCYRFVKEAGRFKVVKRTPGISTTDLVGRMLLCTKSHFIKDLDALLEGQEGPGGGLERKSTGEDMKERIREYATDESGNNPLVEVWSWRSAHSNQQHFHQNGSFLKKVNGTSPLPDQKVIYVDGGFDLFSTGHIEFLKQVVETEEKQAKRTGWDKEYSPIYVVAGVHSDEDINDYKGINYPIMNIFERGLCVLQCKYISSLIFMAPTVPSKAFLESLPYSVQAVYHGPTVSAPPGEDFYTDAKEMGIFREISSHPYSQVNSDSIVNRILKSRELYEERQRVKGVKGIGEEAVRRREAMEREKAEKDKAARA